MLVLKWTLTSKTVVFVITISIKTYGMQKLMIILFVKGSRDRYVVAILKDDVVGHLPRQLSQILSLFLKKVQLIVWLLAENIPQIYHKKD